MSEEYQGWANPETWCVNMWLSNDHAHYRHCLSIARAYDLPTAALKIREFTELLCEQVTSLGLEKSGLGMAGNLLTVSLARVDWDEIAEGFSHQ